MKAITQHRYGSTVDPRGPRHRSAGDRGRRGPRARPCRIHPRRGLDPDDRVAVSHAACDRPASAEHPVPGTDVAGTVEAVGKDVQRLRPGDEVFGWCAGAFAEFTRAREDQFLPKPARLSFEQAAAVGVSASTALQLLRDSARVTAGPEGPHQRGVGWCRHVRRADRQGVRCRGHGRDQHARTWSSSARSAPTTSSTTPRRTSRRVARGTT